MRIMFFKIEKFLMILYLVKKKIVECMWYFIIYWYMYNVYKMRLSIFVLDWIKDIEIMVVVVYNVFFFY